MLLLRKWVFLFSIIVVLIFRSLLLVKIACNNDCKEDTNVGLQDHNKKMVTKYRWIGAPYLSNMYYKYLAKSPVYDRLQILSM